MKKVRESKYVSMQVVTEIYKDISVTFFISLCAGGLAIKVTLSEAKHAQLLVQYGFNNSIF
jgi:hypothetical protein